MSDFVAVRPAYIGTKADGSQYVIADDDGRPVAPSWDANATGLIGPNGDIQTLSEAVAVVVLTSTGTVRSSACEFRGFVVRAISGTPQTVTIYDATSATGTPIMTVTVTALGTYYWDGDHATAGNGRGGRRINSTGCHVVITGGTSRTIDVMVE